MKKNLISVLLILALTLVPTMQLQSACAHDWEVDFYETRVTKTETHKIPDWPTINNCFSTRVGEKTCTITYYERIEQLRCTKCNQSKENISRYKTHSEAYCR